MNCRNVFCQSFERNPDTANCQCTFAFDRKDCEKRKLFNRIMKLDCADIKDAVKNARNLHA